VNGTGRTVRKMTGSVRIRINEFGKLLKPVWVLFRRDQRGVSAVEFGLLAPILLGGLLTTVDIGLAVTERMTLDHVLRAAAQGAMTGQGTEDVLKTLKGIASGNFAVAGQTTATNPVELSVARECACADNLSAAVACFVTCTGSVPPLPYYRLTAKKTYDGMVIPPIRFERSVKVQAR